MEIATVQLCLLILSLSVLAWIVPPLLIPQVIRKAEAWGVLDIPDERKIHRLPIPRLGGLSLAPSLWMGISVALVLTLPFRIDFLTGSLGTDLFSKMLIGLLIGGSGIFILGCIDDFKGLSAPQKMLFQAIIALVSMTFIPLPSQIFGMSVDPIFAAFLLFSWLVIVPNSVNLLDGIDGLTGVLSSIFFAFASGLAILRGETGWLLITIPLLGAVLSFLRYNWKPARIFLGDSGSLLIGFLVAYLSIMLALQTKSDQVASNWNPVISMCMCSIWLTDTMLAILRRYFAKAPRLQVLIRRSKITYFNLSMEALKNICRPDRLHIHHRLVSLGLHEQAIVGVLGLFAAAMMLPSVSLVNTNFVEAKAIYSPFVLSISLVLGAGALFVLNKYRGQVDSSENEELNERAA